MSELLNFLLVEDEPGFAQWVEATLLAAWPDARITHALSLSQAQAIVRGSAAKAFDLVILDLNLGEDSGAALIEDFHAAGGGTPILVLTAVDTPHKALAAIRAGAQGYVLKSLAPEELEVAVRQMMAGGSPITPSIARLVLAEFHSADEDQRASAEHVEPATQIPPSLRMKLSAREGDVLRLLARGYTDKEASAKLGISASTVDTHVRSIYRKLNINSRVELRRLLN